MERRGVRPIAAVAALALGLALAAPAARAARPGARRPPSPPDCAECHEVATEGAHALLACLECHAGAGRVPHGEVARPACSACHGDEAQEVELGGHGRARAATATDATGDGTGDATGDGAALGAPACRDCHGASAHAVLPSSAPGSPVAPLAQPDTCGRCHADPEAAGAPPGLPRTRPVAAYRGSVHARALASGAEAATCSSCHGGHRVLPKTDPASPISRGQIAATCGACHAGAAAAYADSVHGRAAARGETDAPVCTDCHGEHRILATGDPAAATSAARVPAEICGRCHGDVRLAEKFGLPADRVPSYAESFHGLAARAGGQTVAHCGSCHGVHRVLPSTDSRSSVHPANLAATCGACHPGATERFARTSVHATVTPRTAAYWIRAIYLGLIVLVVGLMALHNAGDFVRKLRQPPARDPAPREDRLSRGFRLAHGLVMVSFPALAYSGFALTYPESDWARPILAFETTLGLRGLVHRAAAIVLLGGVLVHVAHLARDRRARACIAAMVPRREDGRDLVARLRWILRGGAPPTQARLSYIEKAEYLAFLWGTLIMVITGFVLWFEELALALLPGWALGVATAIHFWEAALATLAILVWHLYWVIFDPAIYPMDWSWWTGRAPGTRAHERRGTGAAGDAAGDASTPPPGPPAPQPP